MNSLIKGESADFEIKDMNLFIRLKRDLDHHVEAEIREEADRILRMGRAKNIIFDLNEIDFMDSSGVGLIIGRQRMAALMDGRVMLVCKKKNINRIIRMSGITRLVGCYQDMEEMNREESHVIC